MKRIKRVVVAIYIDPDFYPPTINAILNIAEEVEEVIVISRNNNKDDYPYPPNVRLKKVGKYSSVRAMETQPTWLKCWSFLKFTFYLLKNAANSKTSMIVLYDHFALLSFYISRAFLKNKKVWYHNHDMPAKEHIKKTSIGALAAAYEKKGMKKINAFSLPSEERKKYYDDISNEIPVFILPNYPSLKVYKRIPEGKNVNKNVRIIYQGFIGAGHGLEELLPLLGNSIEKHTIYLVLKGSVTEKYKALLMEMAAALKIDEKIQWVGIGPYFDVPKLTSSCDIGIGINMNIDAVSQTQGTASNKIYEYAACGLPVILYDSMQFRKYLQQYQWAFFTKGTTTSLIEQIELILPDLDTLGKSARTAFEEELNFERSFVPVWNAIKMLEN